MRHYGAVAGDRAAVTRLVRKLEATGKVLVFVYEAGPCGFGIYRPLRRRGHECRVVSPGLAPRSNAGREIICLTDGEALEVLVSGGPER